MKTTAKEALQTIIYCIDADGVYQTNLYKHVMESLSECTSPRGVMSEMWVEEHEEVIEEDGNYGTIVRYRLCQWLAGRKYHVVDTYDTEEEAEDELYDRVYKVDYLNDDQRSTEYFTTEAEAKKYYEDNYTQIEHNI